MLVRGNCKFCVINAIKSIDKHSFLRKIDILIVNPLNLHQVMISK